MGVKRALVLSAADSYLGVILQLASTVVIARVLTPREIGIFAVAAVFAGLATMFRDLGIAEYMIQERDLTREKISAAMSLNITVSWTMAALMYFGAPWVGGFYASAGVTDVMQVIAANFLLVPFGAISLAYFRRELNFVPILACNAAGSITECVVSISMALAGFGYMSLAWASLTSTVVVVVCAISLRPTGFPTWPGLQGLGAVFNFSKFASGIYILSQLGRGAPEMIIGRALGMVDVAMFSRANGLVELFRRITVRPITRVCMPYFSRSEREQGSLVAAYLKSVTYLTAVGWPCLLFMSIAAYSAVRIVYGPQWEPAVALARILCIACALDLPHMLSREALLACGQARRANTLQAGLVLLHVVGLAAVVPFGLEGAAWGLLAASALGLLLSQWSLHRGIGLSLKDMVQACKPNVLLTLGTLAPVAAWSLVEDVTASNYVRFGVLGSLSAGLAWLLCLRGLRHPLQQELAQIVNGMRQRFRGAT